MDLDGQERARDTRRELEILSKTIELRNIELQLALARERREEREREERERERRTSELASVPSSNARNPATRSSASRQLSTGTVDHRVEEKRVHVLNTLIQSEAYSRDRRTLVPEGTQQITAEYLQHVFQTAGGDLNDEEATKEALETVLGSLTSKRNPTSLFDQWKSIHPAADHSAYVSETGGNSNGTGTSTSDAGHTSFFGYKDPVRLMFQKTRETRRPDGTIAHESDGDPRVVALGRVVCNPGGNRKCTCGSRRVLVHVIAVYRDKWEDLEKGCLNFASDQVPSPECRLAMMPAYETKHEGVPALKFYSSESDLDGGGVLVYWPLALVQIDVQAQTLEFQENERKKAEEQKKREKEEAAEKKRREAREAREALEASGKTNPYSKPYSGTKRR
jgi:hypothetical protein